nr:glutamine--fructose-6-phosphate transaminase (isomerizing) [Aeropyrum pernix]
MAGVLCGIIGLAFAEGNSVAGALVRGLKRLEYRGYDSMGVAVIEPPGRLVVRKAAGKIGEVVRRTGVLSLRGRVGIGHTRWATHGPPNDVNAHPHTDCGGRVAVVHNGVIRNYASLRRELEARGHRLVSETDTELVAHLIEEYLGRGYSFLEALSLLGRVLRGSYALALLHLGEPDKVYFLRYKSPLVVGLGEGVNAVASDITAVLDVARDVIVLEDGEFGWISPEGVAIYRPRGDGGFEPLPPGALEERVKRVEWTPESASKAGYPHFMLKEIYEQPRALAETFEGIIEDPALLRAAGLVAGAGRLLIVGAGTSFHAGLVGHYYLSRLAGILGHPVVASEHKVYTPGVDGETVVVAVSQSGETYDTLEAVREWRGRGARVIGVTNVVGSALDREADVTLYLRAGPEIGVAATKTFLAQTILLQTLSIAAAGEAGRLTSGETRELTGVLEGAPDAARRAILASEGAAREAASLLKGAGSMYIIGRGLGGRLAMEAALKVKEVSYIHAEAYPAGESKHGPIALVEPGFKVYVVATSDSPEVMGNAIEMKARGASVTVVAPSDLQLDTPEGIEVLKMPPTGGETLLDPYSLTPYFQLLAYHLAVARGYDPDKPRNLAKTVTVE